MILSSRRIKTCMSTLKAKFNLTKFGLRSGHVSHGDPARSLCITVDASWEKHIGINFTALPSFNPNITHLPVEYPSLKTNLRKTITKHWQEQWTDTSQATQSRRIKPLGELWSSSTRNNRREEKDLARIRLGHTVYTQLHIYKRPSADVQIMQPPAIS